MLNKPIVISITDNCDLYDKHLLNAITLLDDGSGDVLYLRNAKQLDVDTKKKDSYELFESGLDFSMLITDKYTYLKSKLDIAQQLVFDSNPKWIIQDYEFLPSDISLAIFPEFFLLGGNKKFFLNDVSDLVSSLVSFGKGYFSNGK